MRDACALLTPHLARGSLSGSLSPVRQRRQRARPAAPAGPPLPGPRPLRPGSGRGLVAGQQRRAGRQPQRRAAARPRPAAAPPAAPPAAAAPSRAEPSPAAPRRHLLVPAAAVAARGPAGERRRAGREGPGGAGQGRPQGLSPPPPREGTGREGRAAQRSPAPHRRAHSGVWGGGGAAVSLLWHPRGGLAGLAACVGPGEAP